MILQTNTCIHITALGSHNRRNQSLHPTDPHYTSRGGEEHPRKTQTLVDLQPGRLCSHNNAESKTLGRRLHNTASDQGGLHNGIGIERHRSRLLVGKEPHQTKHCNNGSATLHRPASSGRRNEDLHRTGSHTGGEEGYAHQIKLIPRKSPHTEHQQHLQNTTYNLQELLHCSRRKTCLDLRRQQHNLHYTHGGIDSICRGKPGPTHRKRGVSDIDLHQRGDKEECNLKRKRRSPQRHLQETNRDLHKHRGIVFLKYNTQGADRNARRQQGVVFQGRYSRTADWDPQKRQETVSRKRNAREADKNSRMQQDDPRRRQRVVSRRRNTQKAKKEPTLSRTLRRNSKDYRHQ